MKSIESEVFISVISIVLAALYHHPELEYPYKNKQN